MTDSKDLSLTLKSSGSNGLHHLHLTYDPDTKEFWFTLTGKFNGHGVQVDFDEEYTEAGIDELIELLQLMKEYAKEDP